MNHLKNNDAWSTFSPYLFLILYNLIDVSINKREIISPFIWGNGGKNLKERGGEEDIDSWYSRTYIQQ